MSYMWIKLLHVFAMAIWTGGPYIALIGVREEFAAGGTRGLEALRRLQRMTRLFIASALTTVANGAGMIALAGGPSHVSSRLLAGAALSVPIFFIGGGMNRRALLRLDECFRAGQPGQRWVRLFFLAARLEDLLRAAILALMVLPLF
jgi:hypothetical protein